MDRFYQASNQLASLECQNESTKAIVLQFVEDYQAAIEDDSQQDPEAHIDEIGADFLEILNSALGDAGQLKPSLSRDNVKSLLLEFSQRLNCRECPCRRGQVASEGLEPLLNELLPDF